MTYQTNRGNDRPAERARFCIAGNQDWHKNSTVATSPVSPQRAIRAVVAASVVLDFSVHTEDFLRAYLQSEVPPEPIYVWAPPEAGHPNGMVWAFHCAMYGKNDAGRHFHFNIQARFRTIPGITPRTSFDTIYLSPLQSIIATYVDDNLNAGTPAFLRSLFSFLASYDTHKPDHDSIKLAGIIARSDAAGVRCDTDDYC